MSLAILISVLVWMLFSAICSGSEIGLYSVSRIKLHYRLEQGHTRARIVDRMLNPIGPSIIAILIANNLANMMLTRDIEGIFHGLGAWSVVVTTVLVSPAVLLFGEFLPKHLYRIKANDLVYDSAYILGALRILLAPAVAVAGLFTRLLQWLLRARGDQVWVPYASRYNLRSFLRHEDAGHNLTTVQKELIDRVMALERIDCRYNKVVKPLSSMKRIDGGATIAATRNGLESPYYQRYLVTDHGHGRPVGWISAATLATAEGTSTVADLAQPLPTLPATTSLAVALQRMHLQGVDLALVADEQGQADNVLFRNDCLRVLAKLL